MKAFILLSSAALLLVQCTPLRYYEVGGALHKEQQYHSDKSRLCFSAYVEPYQQERKDQLAAIRDKAASVKIDVTFLNMGDPDNEKSKSFTVKRKASWNSTLAALAEVKEWGSLILEASKKTGKLDFFSFVHYHYDYISFQFYDREGKAIGKAIEYRPDAQVYEKGSEGAVELTEELFTLEGLVEVKKIIDEHPGG